ncbi:hypothetical protein [Pseudomonas sp. URMO17WK12:I11]|uniref:hypothetical protein n=1 Tax=Pseudomonas sp. URMO17WK12:I11 TaxID=1283291 RepID=UPI00119FF133|nr:hypothetical protein [Pseudomonas sp. URMO17WK12:I11]
MGGVAAGAARGWEEYHRTPGEVMAAAGEHRDLGTVLHNPTAFLSLIFTDIYVDSIQLKPLSRSSKCLAESINVSNQTHLVMFNLTPSYASFFIFITSLSARSTKKKSRAVMMLGCPCLHASLSSPRHCQPEAGA